jgi:hypothetical protein
LNAHVLYLGLKRAFFLFVNAWYIAGQTFGCDAAEPFPELKIREFSSYRAGASRNCARAEFL